MMITRTGCRAPDWHPYRARCSQNINRQSSDNPEQNSQLFLSAVMAIDIVQKHNNEKRTINRRYITGPI